MLMQTISPGIIGAYCYSNVERAYTNSVAKFSKFEVKTKENYLTVLMAHKKFLIY